MSDMTDHEICVACAEAMEAAGAFKFLRGGAFDVGRPMVDMPNNCGYRTYWPLSDDEQCMAILKRFNLYVIPWPDGTWNVHLPMGSNEVAHSDSLNEAICLAIARMGGA